MFYPRGLFFYLPTLIPISPPHFTLSLPRLSAMSQEEEISGACVSFFLRGRMLALTRESALTSDPGSPHGLNLD